MKPLKESFIKAKDLDKLNKNKYILTKEKIIEDGHKLYRIQALKDIPSLDIYKGDLGGWIESYDNLDQKGDCWVEGEAKVFGNAKVYDNAKISIVAWVYDNAKVYGNAEVYDTGEVYGNAEICGNAKVNYKVNKGKITK